MFLPRSTPPILLVTTLLPNQGECARSEELFSQLRGGVLVRPQSYFDSPRRRRRSRGDKQLSAHRLSQHKPEDAYDVTNREFKAGVTKADFTTGIKRLLASSSPTDFAITDFSTWGTVIASYCAQAYFEGSPGFSRTRPPNFHSLPMRCSRNRSASFIPSA